MVFHNIRIEKYTVMKRRKPPQFLPPPVPKKKRKLDNETSVLESESVYCIELTSGTTSQRLGTFEIPSNATPNQLTTLVNQLVPTERDQPYSFHIGPSEILKSIKETAVNPQTSLTRLSTSSKDAPIKVTFFPLSLYKVRPVTRCSDTLHGHTESILSIQFSSDGRKLATGSGDCTARLWDLTTTTPIRTLKGHQSHVLVVSWSPDSQTLLTGDRLGHLKLWNGKDGKSISKLLKYHKKWVTCVSWEPFHLNIRCTRFVSSSKDGKLAVWDCVRKRVQFTFSGHTLGVTSCRWGGDGKVYSVSQDRTLKVWNVESRRIEKNFVGHSHWINAMSMSTDFVLRRGPFDEECKKLDDTSDREKLREESLERYQEVMRRPLRIVTGSDDNTLMLWEPNSSDLPKRMTGHLGLVNDVKFSPDGKHFASASFDKTILIWDCATAKVVSRLRGHVGAVYKLAWSGDSQLLASCSKDTTCKVWSVRWKKLLFDLPGHFDEVYAVDWSPDGQRVASGGKDRTLKIWRH